MEDFGQLARQIARRLTMDLVCPWDYVLAKLMTTLLR
jgi:hypothetical protein